MAWLESDRLGVRVQVRETGGTREERGHGAAPAEISSLSSPATPTRHGPKRSDAEGDAPSEVPLATRHVMQANKSKNTKPELRVRAALRAAGLPGYRLHWKQAPGRPDICYPGRKLAIFVNGCYWHHCPHCALPVPRRNAEFWEAKFARNRARDERDRRLLVEAGWTVVVVWECRLKGARFDVTMRAIEREVRRAAAQVPGKGPDFLWPALPRVVEVGFLPVWRRGEFAKRLRMRHSGAKRTR